MRTTRPPADHAEALLAGGMVREAIEVATAAASKRDAAALVLLATWRMIGRPLPRDLPEARKLLRRAVEIGHVDGALMEIAMTANGSGGTADWAVALRLLEAAARMDEVAAAQKHLIRQMELTSAGFPDRPATGEQIYDEPLIKRYGGFCSPAECRYIAELASKWLAPAVVLDPATGRARPHPIRTSHNATIGPVHEDLVIAAINRRIAAATETDYRQGEPLAVLRYAPGQQYKLHSDALPPGPQQRLKTLIIYLNDNFAGGETDFPRIDLRLIPRAGDAIEFTSLLQCGLPDPNAWHAGLPVTHGTKWIATRWIRAAPYDPWTASS